MSPQNFRSSRFRSERDRGQATVEFVLTLPLVMLAVLLIAQFLVIVVTQVQVVNATRNAVRSAAVSQSPSETARTVAQFSFGRDINIETKVGEKWVTVTSTYELATDLPMVGRFVPDLTLTSHFSMLLEPPID
ncbi:MAG: TadE family protein [Actinomycetes bacterium]